MKYDICLLTGWFVVDQLQANLKYVNHRLIAFLPSYKNITIFYWFIKSLHRTRFGAEQLAFSTSFSRIFRETVFRWFNTHLAYIWDDSLRTKANSKMNKGEKCQRFYDSIAALTISWLERKLFGSFPFRIIHCEQTSTFIL